MTDQFVIYLGSSDSQNVHPANSNTDFIIDVPTQLLLDGEWEMALLEINRKNVYVYCDWCMEVSCTDIFFRSDQNSVFLQEMAETVRWYARLHTQHTIWAGNIPRHRFRYESADPPHNGRSNERRHPVWWRVWSVHRGFTSQKRQCDMYVTEPVL